MSEMVQRNIVCVHLMLHQSSLHSAITRYKRMLINLPRAMRLRDASGSIHFLIARALR